MPGGQAKAAERLARWREAMERGGSGGLARRWAWDGLSEARVVAALGDVRLRPGAPVPEWASFLDEALSRPAPEGWLDPAAPLPFDALAARVLSAAWERVESARGFRRLGAAGAASLRRAQLAQLCDELAVPLLRELRLRRAAVMTGFDMMLADAAPEPSDAWLRALLEDALGLGRAAFWTARAALARALARSALGRARWLAELFERFDADEPALRAALGLAPADGWVELQTGLSDPHEHGRRVAVLRFASGARATYKPRGAELLAAWEELLGWLEARGLPGGVARRRRLHAPGPHAWLEYVAAAPCRDGAEAGLYHRRAGGLLALLHALQARDLHFENVVAEGPRPVPIDVEVILQGRPWRPREDGAPARAAALLDRSVFAVGLLPIQPDEGEDFGALGEQAAGARVQWRWTAVNTDAMRREAVPAAAAPENSAALLDGEAVDAGAHREELAAGFRETAAFLHGVAGEALESAPLRRLAAAPARVLLRATSVYMKALGASVSAPGGEGVDRSLALEALACGWTGSDEGAARWPLGRAELDALERGDVPAFVGAASGPEVWECGGGGGAPLMSATGLEEARAAWRGLDGDGIAFQEGIIRAALIGRVEAAPRARPEPPPAPFDARDAAGRAAALAEDVGRRALRAGGAAAWVEPVYDARRMGRLRLGILGPSLYSGTAGLALFAAAAGRRELAREAAGVFLAEEDVFEGIRRADGIGGGTGTAGIAYALGRAAAFSGDEALRDAARAAARTLGGDALAADREHDVIFGAAGALLCLLGLHAADPRDEWLERAALCGEQLLRSRQAAGGLPPAWHGPRFSGATSGFSHGAAGAACGLWRLGRATGERRFAAAAEDAWAFEDALDDEATGSWRRSAAEPADALPWSTWCWGAPGIGLGRLEAAAAGHAGALAGVEKALARVRAAPPRAMDHLCCGELGASELLLSAGLMLGRPALVAEARARAGALLAQAKGLDFRLHPALEPAPLSPAFFGGTAGIGYALLRFAAPEKYPNVLTFE